MLELSTVTPLSFSSIILADAHDELLRELDNILTNQATQKLRPKRDPCMNDLWLIQVSNCSRPVSSLQGLSRWPIGDL